jgi:hypothetical protein
METSIQHRPRYTHHLIPKSIAQRCVSKDEVDR